MITFSLVWVRTCLVLGLGVLGSARLIAQAGWTSVDIGGVAVAGSSADSGTGILVRGSGADIWDVADEFRFVYRALSGDGDFVTRVTSLENTHGWAKAGIMFRDGTGAGAANVFLLLTPGGVAHLQQRSAAGAGTAIVQSTWSAPTWLKLTRRGNVFAAFTSRTGSSWEPLGSVTVAMAPSLLVGLAVTSHNDGVLCAATFDPVVPPDVPPPSTPGAPGNLRALTGTGGAALSWTDTAANETGFTLYRSQTYSPSDPPPVDATGFLAATNTIPANSTSYQDNYSASTFVVYYAVRAFAQSSVPSEPRVFSAYSNIAPATYPWSWSGFDFGTPGASGRASNDQVVYTVAGAGADIGGTADAGYFTGLSGSNDIDMRARVLSVANTDPQAKAGIMFRPDDTAGVGVANAYVYVTPAGTVGFQVRRDPNDATTTLGTATASAPVFLRLERIGDTFTGYYSSDGNTWTALGSAYANIPRWQDVGFAVTSRRAGTLCEARFDRLVGIGASLYYPPEWPSPSVPTDVAATGLAPDEIQLAWNHERWPERGCEIQRSTDGVNFERRVTIPNNIGRGRFVDRLVSPGTRYYYRFRSYNPAGYSAFSTVVSAVPPATVVGLADPGSLNAEPWDRAIRLSWLDNSAYETSYDVDRSTDGVNFTRLTTVASSTLGGVPSFVDNTVAGGVTFYYRVRAQDGTRVSGYSNMARATPPGGDPGPAAPTNLTASAPATNRVELGWLDNATNETGYVIERTDGFSGSYTTLVTLGADATGYADTTVNPSTWYSYRVYGRNASGASAYSNLASVRTPDLPPTGPVWQSRDIGTVAAAGSDSESGGAVTVSGSGADIWDGSDEFRFRFQPFTGDGEIVARVTSLGYTNGWAKAGVMFRESLQSGSRHAFMCVSAGNGIALQRRTATGGASESTPGSASGAPRWLRLVRNGGTLLGYESPDGAAWTLVGSVALGFADSVYVGLAVTSHQDGTLTTATFDNVVVRATSGGTLPAPTGLAGTAVAYNRVDLTWADNAASESGYEIQVAPNPTAFSPVASVAANTTSASVTNLYPENTYYFRVRAFDAAGSSAFSNVVSVTTPPYPPPATLGAPTGLVATATSDTTIGLSWTDNSSSELGFEVGLSTDGVSYEWGGRTAANATTSHAAGLQPSTTYYFQVRAYQSGPPPYTYIHSTPSSTATATTRGTTTPPPTPPPAAPTGVAATAVSATQINLSWTDASTNETGFAIETSNDNVTYSQIATTAADATSYAHMGLTGSTTYYYRLRAMNAGGNSAYTTPVSATTMAAPVDTFASQDIGGVAAAGRTEGSGGSIQLTGSGADIWNATDEFRYHYRALTGDGVIVARVLTLDNTDGWAKAGVMFRETLTGNARHATMLVSSAHGTALQYRAAPGAESGSTAPTEAGGAPRWLRLVRTGNTFTGSQSVDGATWTPAGSITLDLPATIYVGLAVTSHNDGVLCTAAFDSVTVTGGVGESPPPPPPTGTWSFGDIGAVGVAGANSSGGNTITISGAGADIWGGTDACRFVYRALTGDGTVEAQVTSMQETNGWAKAGVMIRASLEPSAPNAFAFLTPTFHGLNAQARVASGAESSIYPGPVRNAPAWVRLTRTGSTFTAAWSEDGAAWATFATFSVPMGATAYFGFAVTAHDSTQLNTAVFTDPEVR